MGIEDQERAGRALEGIRGKRLTYHGPHEELWVNLGDDGLREAAYRGG
jgi:hypothetical protein